MPSNAPPPLAGTGQNVARQVDARMGQRFAPPTSFNAATRTMEIVAATETPVKMRGWEIGLDCDWYYEILDCRAESVDLTDVDAGNCPLLDAHSRWSMDQRAGNVTAVRFEPGKVVATGALGQNELARSIAAEMGATNGVAIKVSAGYRREQMIFERFEGDIPVYRVTRWALREVSFVPIAADPNAGVRSGDHVSPCTIMENRTMPEVNTAAGAAIQTNAPAPDGQRQANGADAAQIAAPVAQAPANPVASDDGQRAAPQGVARFSAAAALAFVEQARAFGDAVATRASELVSQNERGEISEATARNQLMQAMAEAQRAQTGAISTGGGNVQVTADAADKWQRGAMASLIERAGLTDMVARAAKMRGETVDLNPGELRGIRNVELARMSLEHAGVRIQSYDRNEIVGMALTHRSSGPFQSTSAFAVLLENVMHKTLQAAYLTAPDTWRRFCGTGSVSDFRPHPRLLRGTLGALDALTENGEFKSKAIPDAAKESIAATTKGNIVGLTRQAIVNDDLGAFNDVTVELGRAAKLSVEKDVYALLALNSGLGPVMTDGKTLFHADHGNIAAVAAAPSVDAFDALNVLMGSQKDISGNEYLDITPDVFLGPLTLKGKVIVINGAEYDPDTAGKLQMPNRVKGLFSDIVGTPRLSGTRYYAFSNPNIAPAIEVVFLDGQQEPYTEMKEGWRIDGTEWKVRFDYGVGALNWRSAATNAGA